MLSPRETRRSGRRSAHSASASTSKSPDSPPPPPEPVKTKDRNSNGRTKRPKQEDLDGTIPTKNTNGATNHANSNGRSKRKGKEKEKPPSVLDPVPSAPTADDDAEEQGITRCICGMNEEDADGGEFMVQCETCNVWQHGLCMGFESEAQLAAAADYYCEQCKPERHQDLLRRLAKKGRESSIHSHNTASRSHSPSHLSKPPKRRNTMNSRDAAFAEDLNEVIKATAAEAAAATDPQKPVVNGLVAGPSEDDDSNARKKRKRGEDDALPKKRTRSASSASDAPDAPASVAPEEIPPPPPPPTKRSSGAKSGNSRSRRGPRKAVPAHDPVVSVEGDEGTGPSKRPPQTARGKAAPTPKRPPLSSQAQGTVAQESSSKRNHSGAGAAAVGSAENSRAYRNSHAYAISQQPLFTSWNLPDYLAHLEHMLPTDIPRPLQVRSFAVGPGGRESLERTIERGVKVKWPSKRMSVGDMNKRVRALVEWVGREQAAALDRGRRREALERTLKRSSSGTADLSNSSVPDDRGAGGGRGSPMAVDNHPNPHGDLMPTMRMMEELMEELISFQERFGPGAKNRERERRPGS